MPSLPARPAMNPADAKATNYYFRFHAPHLHLGSVFGDDWFAVKAEGFARFFGTPVFLIAQTMVVAVWIALNVMGLTKFDLYPFRCWPSSRPPK